MTRDHLMPAMKYRGLRMERTADAAFRTPAYAQGWEPHIPPESLWTRFALFFKRRFS